MSSEISSTIPFSPVPIASCSSNLTSIVLCKSIIAVTIIAKKRQCEILFIDLSSVHELAKSIILCESEEEIPFDSEFQYIHLQAVSMSVPNTQGKYCHVTHSIAPKNRNSGEKDPDKCKKSSALSSAKCLDGKALKKRLKSFHSLSVYYCDSPIFYISGNIRDLVGKSFHSFSPFLQHSPCSCDHRFYVLLQHNNTDKNRLVIYDSIKEFLYYFDSADGSSSESMAVLHKDWRDYSHSYMDLLGSILCPIRNTFDIIRGVDGHFTQSANSVFFVACVYSDKKCYSIRMYDLQRNTFTIIVDNLTRRHAVSGWICGDYVYVIHCENGRHSCGASHVEADLITGDGVGGFGTSEPSSFLPSLSSTIYLHRVNLLSREHTFRAFLSDFPMNSMAIVRNKLCIFHQSKDLYEPIFSVRPMHPLISCDESFVPFHDSLKESDVTDLPCTWRYDQRFSSNCFPMDNCSIISHPSMPYVCITVKDCMQYYDEFNPQISECGQMLASVWIQRRQIRGDHSRIVIRDRKLSILSKYDISEDQSDSAEKQWKWKSHFRMSLFNKRRWTNFRTQKSYDIPRKESKNAQQSRCVVQLAHSKTSDEVGSCSSHFSCSHGVGEDDYSLYVDDSPIILADLGLHEYRYHKLVNSYNPSIQYSFPSYCSYDSIIAYNSSFSQLFLDEQSHSFKSSPGKLFMSANSHFSQLSFPNLTTPSPSFLSCLFISAKECCIVLCDGMIYLLDLDEFSWILPNSLSTRCIISLLHNPLIISSLEWVIVLLEILLRRIDDWQAEIDFSEHFSSRDMAILCANLLKREEIGMNPYSLEYIFRTLRKITSHISFIENDEIDDESLTSIPRITLTEELTHFMFIYYYLYENIQSFGSVNSIFIEHVNGWSCVETKANRSLSSIGDFLKTIFQSGFILARYPVCRRSLSHFMNHFTKSSGMNVSQMFRSLPWINHPLFIAIILGVSSVVEMMGIHGLSPTHDQISAFCLSYNPHSISRDLVDEETTRISNIHFIDRQFIWKGFGRVVNDDIIIILKEIVCVSEIERIFNP
ncbi:hypothetical protein ADUPG1_008301 [Aduncisulcus paluster]|uniref:Uncharacterized protein n=1 Tax=Aduncisulcus paluster TaxID=2918883 RepID=A0ABQ5KRG5_9EUKA|nr:hypothetical protein ADUPG1_008301 [Aduncisulcus paluster]